MLGFQNNDKKHHVYSIGKLGIQYRILYYVL